MFKIFKSVNELINKGGKNKNRSGIGSWVSESDREVTKDSHP